MIKTKVITIGDEILLGQIINSNSAYINSKLYSVGIKVNKVVEIGDNKEDFIYELQDSFENYNITLITGGLGPTHDDITKSVLIDFFEDKLILNDKILEHVKNFFAKREIVMPESNVEQAMVPSTAKIIWNEYGTAPGILMEKDDKVFISMPGVPFEMKAMIDNSILFLLKDKFQNYFDSVVKSKTILTTGIGESLLAEKIGDVNEILNGHNLAFLPSPLGVRLRIDVKTDSEESAKEEINIIENKLIEKIGEYVFGFNEELLEEILGKKLFEKNLTLAVAESCTGGILSSRITDIPGSSNYFLGGVCSYSNEAKIEILSVHKNTISKFGAVSEETAIEMANNVRKKFNSNFGLSTTGIAGPTGGTDDKPLGLTYIGFSSKEKSYAKKFIFGDNRERNRMRTAQAALNILRKEI